MHEFLLVEICRVIDYVRNQIKKRRVEKRLTQSDVALDLGITPGAYSKIESGPTEISVKKLAEIATILEVNITYFFGEETTSNRSETSKSQGGPASKSDIQELTAIINKMKMEIASLKSGLQKTTGIRKKK